MVDHTIFHFEIPAYDIERLRRFYTQLLGWKIEKVPGGVQEWTEYWNIETVPVDEKGKLVRSGINGSMIKRVSPEHKPVNYIYVDSVDECCQKIEELGGKIIDPKKELPGIGWWALLSDPEGNEFGIFESILISR
jgi:predicted enzyme related to lactoylglutathione lyase